MADNYDDSDDDGDSVGEIEHVHWQDEDSLQDQDADGEAAAEEPEEEFENEDDGDGGDNGNNNVEDDDHQRQGQDQNINNNNNVNLLVDDDDDDDDDDEDGDDDDEDEDGDDEEEETTLDGGVAKRTEEPSSAPDSDLKKHSTDCDLVLYFYCKEPIDLAPDHPIMRPGICVSIGLEKSTKLWSVFRRYVEFCNQTVEGSDNDAIDREDLEFVHCQLLKAEDTAEENALMKNDRILVRKTEPAKQEIETERKRLEREADRSFVLQLRGLMPELGGVRTADVILDCGGKLFDSYVRAHSYIISRRCPWLGDIIKKAQIEAKEAEDDGKKVVDDDDDNEAPTDKDTPVVKTESGAAEIEDDQGDSTNDDGDLSAKVKREDEGVSMAANKIEDDNIDDDDDDDVNRPTRVEEEMSDGVVLSPRQRRRPRKGSDGLLVVDMPNHSPEAIKLLLEFCYTNRVVSLGHDAFVQSCKTKPSRHQGPVPPTLHLSARRWPKNGWPTISFQDALSGIALAEEARMPRLSFMCEIAAAILVDVNNVTEALTSCNAQKEISGNDLPRVRKAAMTLILGNGHKGVSEISRMRQFKSALDHKRAIIVPTLLQGTTELVEEHKKKKKDATVLYENKKYLASLKFDLLDKSDSKKRERERQMRRDEKDSRRQVLSDDGATLYDPGLSGWAAKTAKRSLKRMAQHNLSTVSGRRSNRRRTSHK